MWRPVGPDELKLIEETGMTRFPPRLPEQPIFYHVLELEYARMIAERWNVKDSGSGYVTRFEVEKEFADRYDEQVVGGRICRELWVPAEELDEFNDAIVGKIEVIESYE